MIYDKKIATHLIGCLMKKPHLLADTDRYRLEKPDFDQSVHRLIFSAIYNLFQNGAEKITVAELHSYLNKYPELYTRFNEEKGSDFVLAAEELAEVENFPIYYDRIKKLSLLRELKEQGFDISDWYVEGSYDIAARQILEKKLEEAKIEDILISIQGKLFEIESEFVNKRNFHYGEVEEGIEELVESLKLQPEIGMRLQGDIFTSVSRGARKGKLYYLSGFSGGGKAIPNDTVLPTPAGNKKVEEIQVGDLLFDRNGQPTKVTGVYPQGELDVFEITFKDGRKALCNDQHLWTYLNGRKNLSKPITVEKMLEMGIKTPTGGHRYQIPIAAPIQYPEKELPIDPYVFGLILGDGSFREQPSSKSFNFSSETEELPNAIAARMGWVARKNSEHNFTWTFKREDGSRVYVSHLLSMYPALYNTYSEDKFIPREYLEGSIEQRFELLNGLLDTDGSIDSKGYGQVSFFTTSEQLKNDIVELTRSLGFIPTISEDRRPGKNPKTGVCYTVTLQGNVELKNKLFKLSKKREKMQQYCDRKMRREHKDRIAIVNIQKLNYKTPMTCFTVDNKEHLFLMNDYIVTHNTRLAVGNAAHLAYPIRWSQQKNTWDQIGSCQKVLFITTELSFDEIQTMVLANITGINEEKILNGDYTKLEQQRIDEGIRIMRHYKNNFHLYHMPDPSIQQLNANVKRLVMNKQIQHVFYDYVATSPALLAEFSTARIREDVALSLLSTALKNIANELQVFVFSGTQLNAHAMEADFIDESGIRGARSIIEKADLASAMKNPTKDQLKLVEGLTKQCGGIVPNLYIDLFKNRRGRHKRVRIWCEANLGCCRITDLFVTNDNNEPVDVKLLYTKDENATCDITAVIAPTTKNTVIAPEKEVAPVPPTKMDFTNITL